MKATAKLVNALLNGSISATVISDGSVPGRELNGLGGIDSGYQLDPINLTITVNSGSGWMPSNALCVALPTWMKTTARYIWLSIPNLDGSSARNDSAALTAMANAGYLA